MSEDYLLKQLVPLVGEKMGLHFSENKLRSLLQTVLTPARKNGRDDGIFSLQELISSSLSEQQVKTLANHLTVGETYFFREMKSLEAFKDLVISGLTKQRSGSVRRLRVWSAGCSSGEEPYTLAMLIDQAIPRAEQWDIRIYGTDINLQALEKARRGVYTNWSFRGTPDTLRDRYFEQTEQGTYAVKTRFKDMVSFSYLNLATDDYPSLLNTREMDVIFCRNVLMYFTPGMIQGVIRRMHNFLVKGGWLIVAPSETLTLLASEFKAVPYGGATLYRKAGPQPTPSVDEEPFPPLLSMGPEIVKVSPPPSLAVSPPSPADSKRVFTESSPKPGNEGNIQQYAAALAAYQGGRCEEALAILRLICPETAYSHQPGDNEGKGAALMGRILANQGNLERAVEWCEKAISKDKLNAEHWLLLAMILLEQGHGQEKAAVQALKRCLYLEPDMIAAHYLLGTLALRMNRPADTDRHFLQAISLLSGVPKEKPLSELDGITAGRLRETIETLISEGGIR